MLDEVAKVGSTRRTKHGSAKPSHEAEEERKLRRRKKKRKVCSGCCGNLRAADNVHGGRALLEEMLEVD